MSETIQQNGGIENEQNTPNYQAILSKNSPFQPNANLFRHINNQNNMNGHPTYLSFAEKVEQSPYLISLEQKNNSKNKKSKQKKQINSYVANRDKLFIPKPERVHKSIDIFANLIEEEKKIVTVDLGIQSDEIEFDEKNEGQFLPQKLGKDVGTQIQDEDLFNFDNDVQPLITVIVGKTLEQSLLELEQEEEIDNLRKAKLMYAKRSNEDSKRIRNLEEREKQKKYNNDAKKEQRKKVREKRKITQKQLISRTISKRYLRDLLDNSINDLIHRGQFKNFTSMTVKNQINEVIMTGSEKLYTAFSNMKNFINQNINNKFKIYQEKHKKSIEERHVLLEEIGKKKELLRIKKEAEKERAEEARKERRRLRKIERIKKEIKEGIIDKGVQKGDAYSEEYTEIGNEGKNDEPYIGIYGSFVGILLMTLSFVQRDYFQDESLYNMENIQDILKMIFDDTQCSLTFHFKQEAADKIKKLLSKDKKDNDDEEGEKEDITLTDLKNLSDLSGDTWNKIGEILEDIKYNNDIFLRNFLEEFSEPLTDKDGNEISPIFKDNSMYKLIIKCLIDLCSKQFKLLFVKDAEENEEEEGQKENEEEEKEDKKEEKKEKKEISFIDYLKKYEAICMMEGEKPTSEIINSCEFVRPSRKKNIPAPDFDSEHTQMKAYQNNPEVHNVLFYDKIAEFCIRNKVFECALTQFCFYTGIENDTNEYFKTFNAGYDELIDNSKISNTIQVYHYIPEKEKENEENEEEG